MKNILFGLLAWLIFGLDTAQSQTDTTKQTQVSAAPEISFDTPPDFPGGQIELMRFMSAKMQAQILAIQNRPGGRVLIHFDVAANGKLSNFKVVESLRKDIDNIVLNAAKTMPPWKPAKLRGKPVSIVYAMPVSIPASPSATKTAPAKTTTPPKPKKG